MPFKDTTPVKAFLRLEATSKVINWLVSAKIFNILLLFKGMKTIVMTCVSVETSISHAGLLSDWCILTYQGPLIPAE